MLNWLWKRRPPEDEPRARSAPVSDVRVTVDHDQIVLSDAQAGTRSLAWSDLTSVAILTTDAGPFAADLFWLLAARERPRPLLVPMGAVGEHDLLQAMQARLVGFDNMAVIEAMGSTSNASFTVWEAPQQVHRRGI